MVCRRNPSSAILLAFILACTACGAAPRPAAVSTHAAVVTGTEKAPAKSSSNATKVEDSDSDPSLYSDEYEARGVPSIQNPWTVNDYQVAIDALTVIAQENLAFLPRSASKHSGAVFRRLVSRENLAIYANRDIAWDIRKTSVLAITESFPRISGLYLQSFYQGHRVEREMLELLIQQGHCSILMWATMDEVVAGIYRNDPGIGRRMAGLEEMQDGTANILRGMLTMLTDREYIRLPTFLWYVPELVLLVPDLIGRLRPSQQAELQQRIDHLAASEPERELAKQLKVLSRAAARPMAHVLPRPSNMSDVP